jgi:hypothetical protein
MPRGEISTIRSASSPTNQRSWETKTASRRRRERLDQRLDRLEVEVVGRLVEDQHVRLLDHRGARR